MWLPQQFLCLDCALHCGAVQNKIDSVSALAIRRYLLDVPFDATPISASPLTMAVILVITSPRPWGSAARALRCSKRDCRLRSCELVHCYLCSAVWHNECLSTMLSVALLESALNGRFKWCCTDCLGKCAEKIRSVLRLSRRRT